MNYSILFFLLPVATSAQTSFSGTVVNKNTREKIPFATVGLIKENTGTNANANGIYSLVSKKENDTLLFSSVGYEPLRIAADKVHPAGSLIELIPHEPLLREVVISSRRNWQYATLNDFSEVKDTFIATGGYETQLAEHFEAPVENSILKKVKLGMFNYKKMIFRIRVYDIDTVTKGPGDDLSDQVIEIATRKEKISIDMQPYKIHIPGKHFFVAVEWLRIPENARKLKPPPQFAAIEYFSYGPDIGHTKNIGPPLSIWALNYKNVWRKADGFGGRTTLAIAATVKY